MFFTDKIRTRRMVSFLRIINNKTVTNRVFVIPNYNGNLMFNVVVLVSYY